MGNNDLSGSENILIKVDHNNLIYIDPNSVISNGEIEPRGVKQENLMMYVNLEADLVPRTTLVSDNNTGTLFSVAKGTINFLKNQQGGDYDTSWTNAFNGRDDIIMDGKNPTDQYKINDLGYDGSAQSFGIDSINIVTKGFNAIPQVTINFIDVRGKTLFESPENSPYKAFFHLPWPIFYLTVKGYYGKAIRYRLHMVKFSTKFNESNGNFEITTNFVGSTFAYLNDIPINGILNSPYMYMIEGEAKEKELKDGVEQKKITKSSKGYSILKSVYNEYKQKGLVDKDFPVKTLRELIMVAESLDKILEKEIFDQVVDAKVFAGVKEYESEIEEFENSVVTWGNKYLSLDSFQIKTGTTEPYYFYLNGQDKTSWKNVTGKTDNSTLEKMIYGASDGKGGYLDTLGGIEKRITSNVNKSKQYFTTINSKSALKPGIKDYVTTKDGKIGVAIQSIVNDIRKIIVEFGKQRDVLQTDVENKMNIAVKNPEKGIGFNPTVRNIFAVILANAETYIRLMKDVHTRAFDASNQRKSLLVGYSDETPGGSAVYPWPEVKKSSGGGSKHKVIAYPGDNELSGKLQTTNKTLWPEVDFVENYQAVATKKFDTLSEKEGGIGKINYYFESNQPDNSIKKIGSLDSITFGNPYSDKAIPSVLYEIFERSYYMTLLDSFNNDSIKELANIEYENIKKCLSDDFDIKNILKTEIKNSGDLYLRMAGLSPFERYPYLKDQLPTTSYLVGSLNSPYNIEQYNGGSGVNYDNDYTKLSDNLKNYAPESYRKNIYPYNSSLYLSYINKSTFTDDEFKFDGNLKVDTKNGLISSPLSPKSWIKLGYTQNMFHNNFNLSGTSVNILNTPYFHKQLYSDFGKSGDLGRYTGSAYLLLNSLPFYDLEDKIDFNENNLSVRMSSLFREVGSTHFIPYHLMLKWGSIYHRYKTYINDGVDILDGFLNTSGKTVSFDGKWFFDEYMTGTTFTDFTTKTGTINYSGHTNVGIHPFYDAVFHNIVNGYSHYDISLGDVSFSGLTLNDSIVTHSGNTNGTTYWTTLVDNSKYELVSGYTLLPCNGYINNATNEDFFVKEQRNMKIIWTGDDDLTDVSFSGVTFPSYNEYNRTYVSGASTDNQYGIGLNYRKVIDLIGTFSPDILTEFETMFLSFASGKMNVEIPFKKFGKVEYYNFQDILKDLCTVDKLTSDPSDIQSLIQKVKQRQSEKLIHITDKILSNDNLLSLTIANPKEIDANVIGGFADVYTGNTFVYGEFDISQVAGNTKYIDLYVGEDVDGNYLQFFPTNDVQLSEDNVITFRPLIQIFAGLYKTNPSLSKSDFQKYLRDNIITLSNTVGLKLTNRHSLFLDTLIPLFQGKDFATEDTRGLTAINGYNDDPLKIEMYSYFKSFNDKWIGGNSIGQRLLLEEFLFLDKANRDIGSSVYFNLEKLLPLADVKNQNTNLYGALSMLLGGTGFDMRALPAYVNFYGANYSNKVKPMASKTVAKNLFGTFLEVDYQESSPKIIIQFTGPTSKHLDLSKYSKEYKFVDDSFNMENINNHPLVVTTPDVFNTGDLYKSNRVVAFEVSFGDQYQSIFKGIQLDQASIKNTTEAFIAQENLARSESGANAYQVDIGLFDIYRQSSYTCQVSCMGNVMIQPTMYFYLKNVPMFKGSYWITDVTHNIKGNTISTSFTGTRIPYASLPDPKDSLMATYKPFFDSIINKAIIRVRQSDQNPTLNMKLDIGNGKTTTVNIPSGYTMDNVVKESGVTKYGIPYNGGGVNNERYIQMIKYKGERWLQAVAVEMGGTGYTPSYPMSIFNVVSNPPASPLYFSEINKDTTGNNRGLKFYATRFELNTGIPNMLTGCTTDFVNPKNGNTDSVQSTNSLGTSPKSVTGAVHVGPATEEYGIALSNAIMKKLDLYDGQVVYFRIKNDS